MKQIFSYRKNNNGKISKSEEPAKPNFDLWSDEIITSNSETKIIELMKRLFPSGSLQYSSNKARSDKKYLICRVLFVLLLLSAFQNQSALYFRTKIVLFYFETLNSTKSFTYITLIYITFSTLNQNNKTSRNLTL